jgi:predicted phosphodiesterase
MRVIVLSDVHGNLPALEAVLAEPHDLILCLGDLVGFGPDPGACVRRIRETAAVVVQGDYDRAAAEGLPPSDRGPLGRLAKVVAGFTEDVLSDGEREYLGSLPRWAITAEPGPRCLLVHGTPTDALYGALNPDSGDSPADLAGVQADLILVGQTHRPFQHAIAASRVVSPGSVGLPLDGDPRAAYALIEDGRVTLRRAEYPIGETIAGLRSIGLPGPMRRALERVLRSGSPPRAVTARPAPAAGADGALEGGEVSW